MTDKTLEDMEIWADEARSYCFHVGHTTADTKMADYLNAAVKEVKRHRKAVEYYKEILKAIEAWMSNGCVISKETIRREISEGFERADEIKEGKKENEK